MTFRATCNNFYYYMYLQYVINYQNSLVADWLTIAIFWVYEYTWKHVWRIFNGKVSLKRLHGAIAIDNWIYGQMPMSKGTAKWGTRGTRVISRRDALYQHKTIMVYAWRWALRSMMVDSPCASWAATQKIGRGRDLDEHVPLALDFTRKVSLIKKILDYKVTDDVSAFFLETFEINEKDCEIYPDPAVPR